MSIKVKAGSAYSGSKFRLMDLEMAKFIAQEDGKQLEYDKTLDDATLGNLEFKRIQNVHVFTPVTVESKILLLVAR